MIIERVNLIEKIEKVLPGIDQKGLVEAMTNLHFTKKYLVTFNDAKHVRLPFATDFQCSIHAQTFYNLLKGLSTEKIKLELTDNSLKVNTAGITADLNLGEGSEIGDILAGIDKEITNLKDINPLPSDFAQGLGLCGFSAHVKDIGGSFTCIKVVDKTMMSSDKTRFSLYEMNKAMNEMMFKATVAADMLKYDLKLYAITKSWLHFIEAKDGIVFSVRKYTGDYPTEEILAMVKISKGISKIVLPDELLSTLNILNTFTEGQEQKHVAVTVKDGFITFQVKGTKGSVTKKIKIDTKESFSFGINPLLLTEILKRGIFTVEINQGGGKQIPLAYFKSKNFTHAIALFS